jgi:hypothetical protein
MALTAGSAPLLEKLIEAGINANPDEGLKGKYADVFPHYRGNPGFYHIHEGSGEAIILKGVFGDHIRIIKKGLTLTEDEFSRMARFLFEVKKVLAACAGENYMLGILSTEGECYVVKAEEYPFTPKLEVDPYIPRPLTAAEYDISENGGGKTLYSKGFLSAIFPEIASPYLLDIAKRFPDILACYFLPFNLKIPSPSVSAMASRLYTNISALSAGFIGAGISPAIFRRSYFPWQKDIFSEKLGKPKPFLLKKITPAEITSFLDDIRANVKNRSAHAIFNDDFYEPLTHISFIAFFLNFLFYEGFEYLKSLTELEETELLREIFLSRKSSFFITGEKLEIPEYFDPASPILNVEFSPVPADEPSLFSKLSAFKRSLRKEKSSCALTMLHAALDGRDALLKICAEFHKMVRNTLLEHGRYIKNRKKINDENQVFLFESNDIRRLVNDSYYSNIEPTLEYKENYVRRCAAQAAVYEIYDEDLRYFGLIAEKQTAKAMESEKLSCLSIGAEGVVNGTEDFSDGKIFCSKILSLASLARLKAPKALICDVAPFFSYTAEYCVIHKIPLYYGVRFPEILSRKELALNKEDITIHAANR